MRSHVQDVELARPPSHELRVGEEDKVASLRVNLFQRRGFSRTVTGDSAQRAVRHHNQAALLEVQGLEHHLVVRFLQELTKESVGTNHRSHRVGCSLCKEDTGNCRSKRSCATSHWKPPRRERRRRRSSGTKGEVRLVRRLFGM